MRTDHAFDPPDKAALFRALEATWPPRRAWSLGPVTLRDGGGGGKRVSAATVKGHATETEIAQAEAAMEAKGDLPLFRLHDEDTDLDRRLEARGYQVIDPTVFHAAPIDRLRRPDQAPLDAIASAARLGIHADIWADGGIGPARLAIMDRASEPKAWLLGRKDDRAAAAGFVSISDGIAMVHALETVPRFRRRGVARAMLARAAKWGASHGAQVLALAVTAGNTPANALYASLGMQRCGGYHYRIRTQTERPPAP